MLGESANEPYNPQKYNLYGHTRDMPHPEHTHDGPDRIDMPVPAAEDSPSQLLPRPTSLQQPGKGSDQRIPLPPPMSRDPPQSGGNSGPPEAVRLGSWIIPSTPIMTGNGATRQLADTSSARFSKSQAAVQDAPCDGAYYGSYDDTLYQTQWEAQQEVVSTGAIINPYTGEVSETFENAIPPPDRRGGDQAREMKQKQLRLDWANGGQMHKHEKQDLEQPLPSADAGPISDAQSYQQRQNVAIESLHRQERSTWHNRNDELLQDTQMTRNPYGFRGQQNMVRINPYLTTTNQLDNGGYMPMQEVIGTNETMKPSTRLHKENVYGDGSYGWASADELSRNIPGAVRKSNTTRHVEQSDFTPNPSKHAVAGGAPIAIAGEQRLSAKDSKMTDATLYSAVSQGQGAAQVVASASSVLSTLGLRPASNKPTIGNSMVGAACATASSESVKQTLFSDMTTSIASPGDTQTNVVTATLVSESDASQRQNLYGDAHVMTEHQGNSSQMVSATIQHAQSSRKTESTLMQEEMLQGSAPNDWTAYPALATLMSQKSQKKSVLTHSLNSFVGNEYVDGRPTFGISETENASKRATPTFPTLLTGHNRIQAGQSRIQQTQCNRQMTLVDGALHALPTISENAQYAPTQQVTASTKANAMSSMNEHGLDTQPVAAGQPTATAEFQTLSSGLSEVAANAIVGIDMENVSSMVSSQQQQLNTRKSAASTKSDNHNNVTLGFEAHATYGAAQASLQPNTQSAAYDAIAIVHGAEIGQGTQRLASAPPIFKEDKRTQYTGNVHSTREGQAPAGQGTVNETRGGIKIERLGYEKVGNDSLGFRQAERPEVARVPENLNAAPRVVRDELLSTRNPSGHGERRGRERHHEHNYGGGGDGQHAPPRTRRSLRQYALRSGVPRQLHSDLESNSESEYSEY